MKAVLTNCRIISSPQKNAPTESRSPSERRFALLNVEKVP
jgi:hypothetical protein